MNVAEDEAAPYFGQDEDGGESECDAEHARDDAAQFVFRLGADGFSPLIEIGAAFIEDDEFLTERDGGGGEFFEAGGDRLKRLRCGLRGL